MLYYYYFKKVIHYYVILFIPYMRYQISCADEKQSGSTNIRACTRRNTILVLVPV